MPFLLYCREFETPQRYALWFVIPSQHQEHWEWPQASSNASSPSHLIQKTNPPAEWISIGIWLTMHEILYQRSIYDKPCRASFPPDILDTWKDFELPLAKYYPCSSAFWKATGRIFSKHDKVHLCTRWNAAPHMLRVLVFAGHILYDDGRQHELFWQQGYDSACVPGGLWVHDPRRIIVLST